MALVIIPHFLSIPREFGRLQLLTRVSAPSVRRALHPTSTTALFRERPQVDTISMAAHHGARPVVRRTCAVHREDAAAFHDRGGEGRPFPPPQTPSRAQQP